MSPRSNRRRIRTSPGNLSLLACVAAFAAGAASRLSVRAAVPDQPPGQPTPPGAPPTQPRQNGDKQAVQLQSLPPALRLGARVNLVERQFGVIPTLVLVPDEASYVAAIGTWQTSRTSIIRFPVLIDDGTWKARDRIAQFVRAFAPKSVMRWTAKGPDAALPPGPSERQARIENAAAAAWGAPTPSDLKKAWEGLGFVPPGVVVCSTKDPAWTAALALAAGHGEPILWIDPPAFGDVTGYTSPEAVDAMNNKIMEQLRASGRTWDKLGDDIDAVTLCMTTPSKVFLGPTDKRKFLSLTDWIGRTDEAHGRARWAWCGQIMGDSGQAAFDAMCALFLSPGRAWLFDGYDTSKPWITFDMTQAAAELEKIGIKSILDDSPSGEGLVDLNVRASGVRQGAKPGAPGAGPETEPGMGVDAGLIAFNTSGNPDFFDLKPGRATPLDIPILQRPAMVYFVHSFSAASPTSRGTVAGMWRERGAYAYLGSVDEPFLQAFVPTPLAMARLAVGYPWAAAVRIDGGEIWKLAVFGDPLITIGPASKRAERTAVPLADAHDIGEDLPNLLKLKDYQSAMWTLALTGRDKDAARLITALAKDDAGALTPQVALAGVRAAYVTGDYQAFLLAASKAAPLLADENVVHKEGLAEVRDMVWQATWPSITKPSGEEADLLAAYIRPDALDHDGRSAVLAADSAHGAPAARAVQQRIAEMEAKKGK